MLFQPAGWAEPLTAVQMFHSMIRCLEFKPESFADVSRNVCTTHVKRTVRTLRVVHIQSAAQSESSRNQRLNSTWQLAVRKWTERERIERKKKNWQNTLNDIRAILLHSSVQTIKTCVSCASFALFANVYFWTYQRRAFCVNPLAIFCSILFCIIGALYF